jgi:prepilin-type N-terminal cleavage/methylation domain-containing protein
MSRRAFTLLELLAVLVVLSILVAILVPTLGSVRVSVSKAKTKVRFNQWAAAIESFRNEYGCYPVFDRSNLVNAGASAPEHPFHDVLAARRCDGSALADESAAARQNRKRICFHRFVDGEFAPASDTATGLLCDAFGGTEIAVLVDRDLDGRITAADCGGSLPLVDGLRPASGDFPVDGVRAGVVFYSAVPGATPADPRFVFSWK